MVRMNLSVAMMLTRRAEYTVWARALGKPGGSATATTCATVDADTGDDRTGDLVCSTENMVLTRSKGKSSFHRCDPGVDFTVGLPV